MAKRLCEENDEEERLEVEFSQLDLNGLFEVLRSKSLSLFLF